MKRVISIIAGATLSAAAFSQVTVLISIPVADIKGIREVELGHLVTGNERNVDKRYYHFGYAILGVHERVELAASTDYNGGNYWGFKVKVLDDPKGQYALSGGFQNIRGGESHPYVVGRYNFGPVRVHAGWYRNDQSRFIAGLEYGLCEGLTLAADHWSGENGATWLGAFYSIPGLQGLMAIVSVGFPSEKSTGIMHTVGLVYGFRF